VDRRARYVPNKLGLKLSVLGRTLQDPAVALGHGQSVISGRERQADFVCLWTRAHCARKQAAMSLRAGRDPIFFNCIAAAGSQASWAAEIWTAGGRARQPIECCLLQLGRDTAQAKASGSQAPPPGSQTPDVPVPI